MSNNFVQNNEVNILEKIELKISEYLNIKDNCIDDNYLEVLNDGISVIKAFTSISKLIKKKRLSYFLKGLSKEKEPSFEQLCKLYDYIDDEGKAEFIADGIDKVIKANSKLCAFLIGLVFYRIINSDEVISHQYLIYVNAMSQFFDKDINNLLVLEKYLINKSEKVKKEFDFYYGFKPWCRDNKIDCDENMELTVEKSVSNQLFVKYIESNLHTDERDHRDMSINQEETLSITKAGLILFDNLKYLEIL